MNTPKDLKTTLVSSLVIKTLTVIPLRKEDE